MYKRISVVVAAIICIVIFFSSCDALTFNSPENLLRPPKLSGDDGELQSAFEKAVAEKGEYILKYPSAGQYRSAFVRKDCDGDGADEAFVFYSLKAEEMSVYMYMLDFKDRQWQAVSEVMGEGNDVYSIDFCDLNADGTAEVLVGWSSIDSKANKKLSIYYSDNHQNTMNYKMIALESYTQLYTIDIDSDGHKEILTALINATPDSYTTVAKLLKMTNVLGPVWQISPVGQVNLYQGITSVVGITSGLSGGRRYIYIDEAAGDSYLTEMLYWDNSQNMLASAFSVDSLSIADCPTSRNHPLVCTDVNKDGELEIPVTRLLRGSSVVRTKSPEESEKAIQNVLPENIYVTSWLQYDEGRFTVIDSYIENADQGFRIAYDEDNMADWAVKFFPDEGISQFFMTVKSSETDALGDPETYLLFTLEATPVQEEADEESIVASSDEHNFVLSIAEKGEDSGIDAEYIRSIFSLSEKQGDK